MSSTHLSSPKSPVYVKLGDISPNRATVLRVVGDNARCDPDESIAVWLNDEPPELNTRCWHAAGASKAWSGR